MDQDFPIVLKIATDREKDKGRTNNYGVYAGGGQVTLKNDRGENVIKSRILGGNGTVYVSNDLSAGIDEMVLLPKRMYDDLVKRTGAPAPAKPKGRK